MCFRSSNPRWLHALVVLATVFTGLFSQQSMATSPPGTVVMWGGGRFTLALPPGGISNAVGVAGGSVWSLALLSDGTVYGWGKDLEGEATGVPMRNFNVATNAFVTINGARLSGVVAIAAGGFYGNDYGHSLALRADGTVVAWGVDSTGFLAVPAGLNDVVAIAAGSYHNVALRKDGTVKAWGGNWSGSTTGVSAWSNIVAIAAGSRFTLGLRSDGSVVAVGENITGPVTIPPPLTNAVAIAAGSTHALALTADGTVVSWGNQTNVPLGLGDVIAIAASGSESGNHSLALRKDGTVVAWGQNDLGQTNTPVNLGNVVAIAAGSRHSLAIGAPLQLRLVGLNESHAQFEFRTFSGQQYMLQYTDDLGGDWAPLPGGNILGTGYDVNVEDATPLHETDRRFYRLLRTQ